MIQQDTRITMATGNDSKTRKEMYRKNLIRNGNISRLASINWDSDDLF